MFDGLYQNETDQALSLEAETPRADPKKKPGMFTGMGRALVEGPAQGALESARAGLNVLSEFGKAAAFAQGASKEESIDRMFTEENPDAKKLGRLAKEYDPDPEASSKAAQVVHEFAKFGTKIAGAALLAGPAAPLVVGADEGISEGLKLADKGVDAATAVKAGAVHGAATAAAVAVPVAGKTILQTVGLAAVGGPAAFMAEQATIREILESADYSAQAAEYDPFDTTGLAVSFLGPLAFGVGAHALRGAKAKPDAKPAPAVPDEVVDAARVQLLTDHDLALVRGTGPEAVLDHAEGRAAAAQRIQDGESLVEGERGAEATTGPAAVAEEVVAPKVTEVVANAPIVEPAPVAKAAEAEATVHPEVQRAQAAIAARGDFEIELEDGTRVSAKQALADADQVMVDAQKEGSAIAAAAECFLEIG